MTDTINITLSDGTTLDDFVTATRDTIASLTKQVETLSGMASSVTAIQLGLASTDSTMAANQEADAAALAGLQEAVKAWAASKASGTTTGTGSTTATGSSATGTGTATSSTGTGTTTTTGTTPTQTGSGGGSTTSAPVNTEGLSLSIAPGTFTFSNIPVGNNTICIVGATNSKTPANQMLWSIVRSSVPLKIDYAGYVDCMASPGVGPITFTVQGIDHIGGSTAQATFSIPVVQIGAQTATRAPGAFTGLPTTGLVQSNKFLTGSAGVVGFNVANNTAAALPQGYVRFVQAFTPGAVPKGSTVDLVSPGVIGVTQCDPINTYSDGSLKTALITVAQPAIASGAAVQYLLGVVGGTTITAPVDLSTALTAAKYALTFDIQMLANDGTASGSPVSIDLVAAMQAAIAGKTASTLQSGPLVTQQRVVVPISGSLYLNADFSAFFDGSIRCDIAVRNDIAMSASGGPIYTSGTITQNGTSVYSWNQLYQTQYQCWLYECGTDARYAASVQLDPAYLIKAAVIQPYGITKGVDATAIVGYENGTASPGWLAPLATNGVDTGMPGTGGRPDIGYETQSATVALITQDPRAVDYCCAQADASGSAPWNIYDAANECFVSTANYPDLWIDGRAALGKPGDPTSQGLTQRQTGTPQNWDLDQAHQPDLSFVPWLYTARRHYLDQVMMQGAWSVVCQYNRPMTIPGTTTVVKQSLWGSQVRGIAWMLRQVSNAGLFAPDGSSYATYFADIMQQNATYGLGLQAYLKPTQGNCWGYLAQDHGQNNFAPWEMYYLLAICGLAGARGYPGWTEITNFFARFAVESALPQADGPYKGAKWCPRDASAYDLFFGIASTNGQAGGTGIVGTPAQTWAEANYWTVRGGQSNSGATWDAATDTIIPGTPNWSHSAGDYGQLTMAGIVWGVRNGVPNAQAALAAFLADPPPYTDAATYQTDPTFSLAG
ncbi:hypothetical protein [Acidiphilium angustum]|uniref:hypothetical protein n=1 Tax=Acidiphilium angustum TaxID=523 RepID=UPI0012DE044C|nr:hypothetical protein [Acidiphilium angustum]